MKKGILIVLFSLFIIVGITISVINFSVNLVADELPPGYYEGTAITNYNCIAGWECVNDGGHTCDAQEGRGCR